MTLAWWLFVRLHDSIRIDVITPVSLAVSGPGQQRVHHAFDDEQALTTFALALQQELLESGWEFAGFGADRRLNGSRRIGPDDRRAPPIR